MVTLKVRSKRAKYFIPKTTLKTSVEQTTLKTSVEQTTLKTSEVYSPVSLDSLKRVTLQQDDH